MLQKQMNTVFQWEMKYTQTYYVHDFIQFFLKRITSNKLITNSITEVHAGLN